MGEWKEYRFSDFVDINPTVGLKAGLEYSFIEMKNLKEGNKFCIPSVKRKLSGGARFVEGDTLFARITPCLENGKICKVKSLENGVGFGSTEFLVFRGRENISDNDFVYYLSRWDEVRGFAESNFEGTSGRQRVPKSCFDNLFLDLPDYTEQKAIASILSSLDDKIDLLHRQNKTLEALAETLFRQWFVDNSTSAGKLGNLVETTFGGEWGKENLEGDYNLPVYCIRGTDIADLQEGLATRTPVRFVKEKKYKSIEMQNGDLIMEISGGSDGQSTGRTILISDDVKSLFSYPLVFSNFCRLIRPAKPEYALYLLCYINMLYDQGDFFNLENGSSGIRNFDYKAFLYEMDYDLHVTTDIINFNEAVKAYFDKINKNKLQIRTLTQLRDTLLPKLMSGEVRVKNV